MTEILSNSVYFGVVISVLGYSLGLWVKSKLKWGVFNPLLISIIFVILVLVIFNIEYESYNEGAKYLSYLLTPATVCLAVPLYQQLQLLKNNLKALTIGITTGVLSSLTTVTILSKFFQLTDQQFVTLLPKSITTAIGIGVSEELGGIITLTVATIILTGIFGNIIAVSVCKLFKITEPIAIGLAIGTSSHVMGTTKALEIGEVEGAMSSLAIVVAGLVTVLLAPLFASFPII
ncbi:LrgB family protein [Proteinivorax hydrogeniformans]|uniref:LrgB family protein n=1 Tax=Proteinivorax hydrogeniformans TaxID=1826727 RepID=A0AAU8HRR1_9FIRM